MKPRIHNSLVRAGYAGAGHLPIGVSDLISESIALSRASAKRAPIVPVFCELASLFHLAREQPRHISLVRASAPERVMSVVCT